jgi:predicted amidophosphoribosyltransferase
MDFRSTLFQFFLPPQCPCCEKFLEEDQQGFCSNCLSEIRWIEPPFCSICGIPFISKEVENHPCGACLTHKKYFTMARALGTYEGSLQQAIHHWKYEGKMNLTPFFAEWMAEGLKRYWKSDSFDFLIPVPLHIQRLRERGFNHEKIEEERVGPGVLEFAHFPVPALFRGCFCPGNKPSPAGKTSFPE